MSTEQQSASNGTMKPAIQVPNPGRRRIARAGIGAAGVLLTLESRVAMATGPTCVAPSAAALSHGGNSNYVEQGRCDAIGPERWVEMELWPYPKDTEFGRLFRSKGTDSDYAQVKLFDLLALDEYQQYIGRAFATTFLNIRSGKLTVMKESTLFKMWDDLQDNLVYSPMPTVTWTPLEVRAYLESTYFA